MADKYVVYSAGKMGVTIKRYAEALNMQVVAFFDNNTALQGGKKDGLQVFTLVELEDFICTEGDKGIIIGSLNYQKELHQEIVNRFGNNINIIEPDTIQERYWNEIVKGVRNKLKDEYHVSYDEQVGDWIENLMSEVEYWIKESASAKGKWHDGYLRRLRNRDELFSCKRFKKELKENDIVIDAGCGICSVHGTRLEHGCIQLVAIDPLAYFYNKINSFYGAEASVSFGLFEFLSLFIGKDIADVVLIDNALDHCIDPYKSVIESLNTLKVGGVLSMRHRRCEAVFEGYSGLHKWNVDINDANEFILWNEDNMVNVNKALQDYAKIDVVLQKGCGRSEEMIEINIYKEKQFERNLFFDVEVDCKMLAQIVDKLMRMLSLPNINQQFEDLLKYV